MALGLPRFAVFQSTVRQKNYLRYSHQDGELHGFLQFSEEEIVSPFAKFEIEWAKTAGNNRFVHIRCCYNYKYWVANSSSNNSFIIAGADEPNEDQSQWSCTLFEPIPVEGEGGSSSSSTTVHVRFCHVQLGRYLTNLMTSDHYHACVSTSYDRHDFLDDPIFYQKSMSQRSWIRAHYHAGPYLQPTAPARLDVFGIIDWESLLILPKHIALKGDNGLYLSACSIKRRKYLQFTSSDIGDPTVWNEVFITKDGSVRIKNNHFGKFWRRRPNWIRADSGTFWRRNPNVIRVDSDDTITYNLDTLFYPVKVGDNVIALRNRGNNNFCNSHGNYLKAAATTLSREARLVVEELVILRKIYNVNFRLLDARIYNQNIITKVTKTSTNDTQVSNTVTLRFLRKETKSSTWNGSVSIKLGVKTEIQTGIPFIVEGKVEVSAGFSRGYQWGETISTENQVETEYAITVPPMSKVTVSLLAREGSCDVPYSYTQRDTLMNGEQVIHNFDDGVYTGINSFNFFYQSKQEKL